jgi:hypothetical protein
LLPAGIALTAGWALVVISRYTAWNGWLRYVVLTVAVVAVAGLIGAKLMTARREPAGRVAAIFGLVAVILTPAVWSGAKAFGQGQGFAGGVMPSAGPTSSMFRGGPRSADIPGMPDQQELENIMRTGELPGGRRIGGAELSAEQRGILDYVTTNAGKATIVLAVEGGAMASSSYIINSDATVIGMGGFMGGDNAPSVDQLTRWQQDGRLAFVLSGSDNPDSQTAGRSPGETGGELGGFRKPSAVAAERAKWVQQHCTAVPPTTYGGTIAPTASRADRVAGLGGGDDTLYNCLRR